MFIDAIENNDKDSITQKLQAPSTIISRIIKSLIQLELISVAANSIHLEQSDRPRFNSF